MAAAPSQKMNILLVDDRPENLLSLEAVLGDLGHNLVRALSGREALQHVLEREFAVILLDVQMPDMDGFETALLIRGHPRSQHTPILFLTAVNNQGAQIVQGYAAGAIDYLCKPFDADVLRAKVTAFVELYKKAKELEAEVARRRHAEEEVRKLNRELERRVAERTAALEAQSARLQAEIAQRERTEAELLLAKNAAEAASRVKSLFLANMSHELRTPLNAVIGYSEMLREEAEAGGQAALVPDLRRITDAGKHLLAIINDILDLSKIEAGRMDLVWEEVAVEGLAREVMETVKPLADKNGNTLELHLEEAVGTVRADPMRLRQSLLNLLGNACKFTEHGTIGLAVRRDRGLGRLLFVVTDSGIGITAEQMGRLFDSFSQADPSTTRKFGGTGLGLAISRRFSRMMGGDISAESVPGRGSTFTLWLPARGRAPSAKARARSRP